MASIIKKTPSCPCSRFTQFAGRRILTRLLREGGGSPQFRTFAEKHKRWVTSLTEVSRAPGVGSGPGASLRADQGRWRHNRPLQVIVKLYRVGRLPVVS